jgi:uncharacterized membrane protein YwzB
MVDYEKKLEHWVDNVSLVFIWVGMWALTEMWVEHFTKNHKIKAYIMLFIVGTLLVFFL